MEGKFYYDYMVFLVYFIINLKTLKTEAINTLYNKLISVGNTITCKQDNN